MKHTVSEYTDIISLNNLGFGAKGTEWFAHLVVKNTDGKTTLDFRFGTDLVVTIWVSPVGVLRFGRTRRGEPLEYLQRDLVSGEVSWNSAKPYTASGRGYVEVALGLDLVLE